VDAGRLGLRELKHDRAGDVGGLDHRRGRVEEPELDPPTGRGGQYLGV
jgi:hypothetical protein